MTTVLKLGIQANDCELMKLSKIALRKKAILTSKQLGDLYELEKDGTENAKCGAACYRINSDRMCKMPFDVFTSLMGRLNLKYTVTIDYDN